MRTTTRTAQADQVRHLSENLITQLTKGREWATPGVEAALQRVVVGLDSGIESASPMIQTGLRRLADELAGGVETLAPRVHEGLKRAEAKVFPVPAPAKSRRTGSGKAWLIAGVVAVAVTVGVAAWLSFRRANEEPVPSVDVRRTGGAGPDADAAPAGAQA
ncbi:hypothetical protein [Arthrobacter sp. ok362]|uniref:hypothetical protein n=1 Tax=Arthrobacter sp. ok362 TaxID=1761745 RepID=UPI00087E3381|nr:hypothetical protein [Arthrobacter sp. ok362]SDK94016.1 hypothetical protein SAMN04487913_104174 [Arthrobacter sp. ok362]